METSCSPGGRKILVTPLSKLSRAISHVMVHLSMSQRLPRESVPHRGGFSLITVKLWVKTGERYSRISFQHERERLSFASRIFLNWRLESHDAPVPFDFPISTMWRFVNSHAGRRAAVMIEAIRRLLMTLNRIRRRASLHAVAPNDTVERRIIAGRVIAPMETNDRERKNSNANWTVMRTNDVPTLCVTRYRAAKRIE